MQASKQILLGYGVKTLTGNVELVRTLNRFGHSVSYSQLEKNDTALCLQKLAAALNEQVILPESIQPYLFTNLAFDNIDHLEETLTGAGTTHRVNGIAVQPRVYGPHPQKLELPEVEKLKQRSVITERKQLPTYIAGVRCGPQPLHTTYTDDSRQQHKIAADEAQSKDFIWLIARQVDTENQIIPSWTGFNMNTRNLIIVSKDVVGYLPTIDAPATELSTVYEIMNQSNLMMEQLHLERIVVVMDQA